MIAASSSLGHKVTSHARASAISCACIWAMA
jgi:hypothetical protein